MNAPLPEHIRRALDNVTLDDKYSLDVGRAFMSGVQALVKLPMLQRQRDALQRLPWLSLRHLRPSLVEGQEVFASAKHCVPARCE
jgi:hypothetical protein